MSSLTVRGNPLGTGTVILESPNTNTNRTITLPDGDASLVGLVRMNSLPATSGAAISFTGIPSWAKRITMMLQDVSVSATSSLLLQIGDSGGIENTGYASFAFTPTTLAGHNATGFLLTQTNAAAPLWSGTVTLLNLTGNTWVSSGVLGSNAGNWGGYSGGSKTLSAVLDRLQLTTIGADTFDGGNVNVIYEG